MLVEGFVRDDGRLEGSAARGPATAPTRVLELAAPGGDELLVLTQRVIQDQLEDVGLQVDLVTGDPRDLYSTWAQEDPFDMVLRRSMRPGRAAETAIPLYRVATMVAFRPGIGGLAPNPTIDGPLWNIQSWYAEAG